MNAAVSSNPVTLHVLQAGLSGFMTPQLISPEASSCCSMTKDDRLAVAQLDGVA